MNLHLVSLPHTQVSAEFCGCAYTNKVLKFAKMMGDDYDIFLYAPEGPDVEGATLIPCLSEEERKTIFGQDDPNRLPAWPTDEQSERFNQNVIGSLSNNLKPHDLILLSMGWTHRQIADAYPNHICCEPGVGYEGIRTDFCAFESYAWMHHLYAKKGINDGRWFDCVIPNYFDPDDFTEHPQRGDYLLFLGRLIARKGPHIASEIAEACDMPLIVAGAGGKQVGRDIVAPEVTIKNAHYEGPVNVEQRAKLMTNAYAVISPTTYIEPFGGVAVEAMMCGTPVITTDFGAFTETVDNGVSGFRFRTLSQAIEAVEKCGWIDPYEVRHYARSRYSLDAVRPNFIRWFNQLETLWKGGWYERTDNSSLAEQARQPEMALGGFCATSLSTRPSK